MGNKLGRRRQVVDEKYTKPQGLFLIKDVDYKKLRKLILESKLAPCYPGGDECDFGLLEECPICFLYYPTLNRSRCCMKSICTECFLQMKNPNSACHAQCPFCKGSNYAVEYRGVKSKKERGLEQAEEQKVIEAKIRMQQKEKLQEQEERMNKRQEASSSVGVTHEENINCSKSRVAEGETLTSSHDSNATPLLRPSLNIQQDSEFDVDLEDIMVVEAIWLSIQESERQNYLSYENTTPQQYSSSSTMTAPLAGPSSSSSSFSPSGGLACAIAAFAERQQIRRDPQSAGLNYTSVSETIPMTEVTGVGHTGSAGSSDGEPISPPPPHLLHSDCVGGNPNNAYSTETGKAYNGLLSPPPPLPPLHAGDGGYQSIPGPVAIPESFEEQMLLAMAVSFAEARARTAAQGV